MRLRPASLAAALAVTLILAVSGAAARPAQESAPPQTTPPAGATEEKPAPPAGAEDEKPATPLSDRLVVRVGAGFFKIHTEARGMTQYIDSGQNPRSAEQTNQFKFKGTTGAALDVDVRYKVHPHWSVAAEFITSSPSAADFEDERKSGEQGGPGDFLLARMESEYEVDHYEWALGGVFHAFPSKKFPSDRFFFDVMLSYRKSRNEHVFDVGRLTANPFDHPVLNDPFFDPQGNDPGNYDASFEALDLGFRFGGKITERFTLDGLFEPTVFGRFESMADLGSHGMYLSHDSFGHLDPVFHTTGCDFNVANDCRGLYDNDLVTPTMKVEQRTSRLRGIRVGLNLDTRLTDSFGIAVGYLRQDYRTSGGEEKRTYGSDAAAGCPTPDPQNPVPICSNDEGDLGTVRSTSQQFYVMGRFLWF